VSQTGSFKRWAKRAGVLFAALLTLLFLFLGVERLRGGRMLKNRLVSLEHRGERLNLEPLIPKPASPTNNAMIEINQLTNSHAAIVTNSALYTMPRRFAAPGSAIAPWQVREWNPDGKSTNTWISVGAQIEASRDVLLVIEAAARKPRLDAGFDYGKGFVDFQMGPLSTVRRVGQALHLVTEYELSRGNFRSAYTNLLSLINFVVQEPEPIIISQLVRQVCATLAFHATWDALQTNAWSPDQLTELQRAWSRADFANAMAASLVMERALSLDFYRQIKASPEKLGFVAEQRDIWLEELNPFLTHGFVLTWIQLPVWRFAWSDLDSLRSLNLWQEMIDRERNARTNSWAALLTRTPAREETVVFGDDQERSWIDRLRFPFSSTMFGLSERLIRRTLSVQTQQAMAVAALALKRYELRNGRLPRDLGDLVPDFLAALPRDHMDGQALRYHALGGGKFLLYSVGENGKDDGGEPSPPSKTPRFSQIWDGADAVWPSAATAAEQQPR
jgi:hypothetical protein